MKFTFKATATEVRANSKHEITGTVTATSATDARSQTIIDAARHGYQINGLPEVEEQH